MLKLIKFIVIANAIVFLIVYLFELTTGYLNIKFVSDYAFYSMLIFWIVGSFFSSTNYKAGMVDPSNVAAVAASSLVENDEAEKHKRSDSISNVSLGYRLFISSLLSLLLCFLL